MCGKGTQESSTMFAMLYFLGWFVGNSSVHCIVPYTFWGNFIKTNGCKESGGSPRVLLRRLTMSKKREESGSWREIRDQGRLFSSYKRIRLNADGKDSLERKMLKLLDRSQ